MEKYELLPQQLLFEGTLEESHFFAPSLLSDDILHQTHSRTYCDDLRWNRLSKKAVKKIGFPLRPELIDRGLHISRGTIECAIHALENGVALNIAGGTHHAYADHGEGFCVFNDFAIAANYLLNRQFVESILIVDLDVHQGNGTAHIFKDEKRVFTFSMHGARNYPLRKEKSDLDIDLADHIGDSEYLDILKGTLPELIEDNQPEIVLYLAGADVIKSDALGRLDLSISGARERDQYVFSICESKGIPIAVSMGGGYSPRLRDIIEVHANTFRVAVDVYS